MSDRFHEIEVREIDLIGGGRAVSIGQYYSQCPIVIRNRKQLNDLVDDLIASGSYLKS